MKTASASRFAGRRRTFLPLPGERAGVREVPKPFLAKPFLALCLALTFCLLAQFDVQAQNYSIGWHKIAGGGGTSTNGPHSISGTIGQPDAGTMSGGNFSLTGGFWGIVAAVQNPPAPLLSVTRSNTPHRTMATPLTHPPHNHPPASSSRPLTVMGSQRLPDSDALCLEEQMIELEVRLLEKASA